MIINGYSRIVLVGVGSSVYAFSDLIEEACGLFVVFVVFVVHFSLSFVCYITK